MYIVSYHCGYLAADWEAGSNSGKYIAEIWASKWYSVFFLSAGNAVDAFFFMSGLLAAYTSIRKLRKIGQKYGSFRFWAGYVLNRYLRLTPMLVLAVYFSFMINPLLYDGPVNEDVLRARVVREKGCGFFRWTYFLKRIVKCFSAFGTYCEILKKWLFLELNNF